MGIACKNCLHSKEMFGIYHCMLLQIDVPSENYVCYDYEKEEEF